MTVATYPHPLLTDDDLADLTGLSQPAAQRRWLDRHGIAYTVRVDGVPRTTWGAVEAALGMRQTSAEPNLAGL